MLGMLVQFEKYTVVRGLSPGRNVPYLPARKIGQGCRLNYRVQTCEHVVSKRKDTIAFICG